MQTDNQKEPAGHNGNTDIVTCRNSSLDNKVAVDLNLYHLSCPNNLCLVENILES